MPNVVLMKLGRSGIIKPLYTTSLWFLVYTYRSFQIVDFGQYAIYGPLKIKAPLGIILLKFESKGV